MPSFVLQDTLVVFALEVETQGQFDHVNLIHCGIGKVNAAHWLNKGLADWQVKHGAPPRLVLNLGSAGSTHFKAGEIVSCTRFIQRDFDVTPLGFPLYHTPFETMPAMLSNGLRFEPYPDGVCGTGDSFVTSGDAVDWNVVDMEAYALAKVCAFEKIPFACLKYITDGADGHAAVSWEAGLPAMAKALRQALADCLV